MSIMKITNSHKLHISRTPNIFKWLVAMSCMTGGICYGMFAETMFVVKCGSILFSGILGLILLDGWEDVVFDNDLGKVIFTRTSFIDRLLCRVQRSHTRIFPIQEVIAVTMRKRVGVFLQFRNGESIPVYTCWWNSPTCMLNDIRNSISMFLHLERVELWTRKTEWEWASQFIPTTSCDEQLDEQLQKIETEKLAHIGCRNAIKVIATGDRRSDN